MGLGGETSYSSIAEFICLCSLVSLMPDSEVVCKTVQRSALVDTDVTGNRWHVAVSKTVLTYCCATHFEPECKYPLKEERLALSWHGYGIEALSEGCFKKVKS